MKLGIVTEELIESFRTAKGGFDRNTLLSFGISWPPPHGWKKNLIGTQIDLDQLPSPKDNQFSSKMAAQFWK